VPHVGFNSHDPGKTRTARKLLEELRQALEGALPPPPPSEEDLKQQEELQRQHRAMRDMTRGGVHVPGKAA
jgi:hypothetical protein